MSKTTRRSTKPPKDPHAPKKPQSSYFLFSNERREVLKEQHQGKSVTELAKFISAEWKSLDQDRKKEYEMRAKEAQSKYNEDLKIYKETDNYRAHCKQVARFKEERAEMGTPTKPTAKKGRGPTKPKQPAAMPKRPASAYLAFSNERRTHLREQYPDKKITELSGLIGEEWKGLNEEEKKRWNAQAKVAKEKFDTEFAEYKKTDEYKAYSAEVDRWKKEKKIWEQGGTADAGDIKVKLPRKPKDDQCPKRPLTSYFLYAQEVRGKLKEEFPNKAITAIATEISKKWKLLSDEEKKPYNDRAAVLKDEYNKAMENYKGSEAQKAYERKLDEWKEECARRRQQAAKKQSSAKKAVKSQKKVSPKKKKQMDISSDEGSSDSSSESSSGSASDSDASSSSGSGTSSSGTSDSDSDSD